MRSETISLRQFISDNQITMTTTWAANNPQMADTEWAKSASHYKCKMEFGGKQLTTYFSQGSAHTKDPELESVLDSLSSDAAGVENAEGFEDWADSCGYDSDSRSAEATYRACESIAFKLKKFLGETLYGVLLNDTDRL